MIEFKAYKQLIRKNLGTKILYMEKITLSKNKTKNQIGKRHFVMSYKERNLSNCHHLSSHFNHIYE